MGLVHNEQVKFTRVGWLSIGRQHFAEEAQRTLALKEVNRSDEAGRVCPWVDVQPAFAPQFPGQFAIDDAKRQAELVAHLVAPLHLQRGRADDYYLACSVAYDKLLADQPGLNGLAQANIIGDEQVGTRHLDGSHHRVKLVIFQFDAAAEGSLQSAYISARNRTPMHRVKKRIESLWEIKAKRRRQGILLDDPGSRLDFPDDLQFLS